MKVSKKLFLNILFLQPMRAFSMNMERLDEDIWELISGVNEDQDRSHPQAQEVDKLINLTQENHIFSTLHNYTDEEIIIDLSALIYSNEIFEQQIALAPRFSKSFLIDKDCYPSLESITISNRQISFKEPFKKNFHYVVFKKSNNQVGLVGFAAHAYTFEKKNEKSYWKFNECLELEIANPTSQPS